MTQKSSEKLLSVSLLTHSQEAAVTRLYDYNHTFLVAKMGTGKTVICLTAAAELLFDDQIKRVLVIAPKKVCDEVWAHESALWDHLNHLTVAVATGTPKQRKEAVLSNTDILVINYENVVWLIDNHRRSHGCDGLIIDELTKLKESGGAVAKKLRRRVNDFTWRVGMTGTPVSEDYTGLYGQMLMIDAGKALGTSKERYLNSYFFPTDYDRRNWMLRPGSAAVVADLIRPVLHVMDDYRHTLPPIEHWEEVVTLPPLAREMYKALKRDLLLQFDDGSAIVADNAAVLAGKLQQLANGFLYDRVAGVTIAAHDVKIRAVQELVAEAGGPVLIAYWFDEDRQRIENAFNCPTRIDKNTVRDWNAKRLNVLGIHPRSAGHGLNLAKGGATVIWYGPQWSRDLYEQTIARLWRTGQTETVRVFTVIAEGTVDEIIVDRVNGKGEFDKLLMAHLRAM